MVCDFFFDVFGWRVCDREDGLLWLGRIKEEEVEWGVLSFPEWVWRLCLLHVREIKSFTALLLLYGGSTKAEDFFVRICP